MQGQKMTEEIENLPSPSFYKVEDIDVPEDDPWRNDFLERKEQALKLQKILGPIKQPFVMRLGFWRGVAVPPCAISPLYLGHAGLSL